MAWPVAAGEERDGAVNQGTRALQRQLHDGRSRIVCLSHGLLNQNRRYLGGAYHPGCVDDLVAAVQQQGRGLYQLPCPEQRVWGHHHHRRAPRRRATDRQTRLRAQLQAVRVAHPYRTLVHDGSTWPSPVGGHRSRILLLLPGGTDVPDTYVPLMTALAAEYRVIAPAYPPVATMAALTSGAAVLLDAPGVPRAAVVGSSYGGYVAQCVVRRYPERVDRLILAQTGIRHVAHDRVVGWPACWPLPRRRSCA